MMHQRPRFVSWVSSMAMVSIAAAASGCLPHKKTDSSASASAEAAAPPSAAASATSAAITKGGTGRFVYHSKPAVDDDDKVVEPLFTKTKRLEEVVKAMGVFELPKDVPVLVTDEGPCKATANAFYQPKVHGIFVCYPLASAFYKAFLGHGMPDQEAADKALSALVFTVMHEMGHAIIAEDNLGVMGKEEDAVDELATLILIQNNKAQWAADGTAALKLAFPAGSKPAYYDEHAPSDARYYDILCMIYGSDSKKYAHILENWPELKNRALGHCADDYSRKDKAWTTLLAPFTRKPGSD